MRNIPLKKIILSLNEEIPRNIIDDFVNTAIENGITDFFINNPFIKTKISSIEHVILYSSKPEFNPQFLVLESPLDANIIESEIESSKKSNYLIGLYHKLASKEDETEIIALAKKYTDIAFIIVELADTEWKILPFENLIAELLSVDILLFAKVNTLEDSELMSKLLELGVDGIVFTPHSVKDIGKLNQLTGDLTKFELNEAEILNIKPISKADRVCVDTTSILKVNEGMLVGSTANGFALIQAEVSENIFASPRPFRINAGDVSAYILVPSFNEKGDLQVKTRYLSEIQAGDDVIIVDTKGNLRIVTVGRVKIETRPMILLNLRIMHESHQIAMNVILQNAESVHLLKSDNTSISVTKIKRGDRILSYIGPGATHFGTPIKETIIEK
jgi:3-dehydroquinate synthase II